MGRRRHSPVPVYEWRKAFADVQKAMAKALGMITVNSKEAEKVPKYRLVVRLVLNKVLLSPLREALAEKEGVENAEEIKKAIIGELKAFVANWDKFAPTVAEYLKPTLERQGVDLTKVDINKYLEIIRDAAAKTVQLLESGLGVGGPLVKAAEQAMSAA